jgi:hypothetical protein
MPTPRCLVPFIATMAVALAPSACRRESAPVVKQQQRQPAEETPAVGRLRAVWEQQPNRHGGKTEWGRSATVFQRAFDEEIAAGNIDEIQRYVEQTSDQPYDEVAGMLEDSLILTHIRVGDRDRLIDLLASVDAEISSYWSIEERLTSRASNSLTDGLFILFDAYDAAKNAHAKEANYAATWRALGDAPIQTADHDAYMRAARGWYTANKDRLERSTTYDHMDLEMWRHGSHTDVTPPHLFALKTGER